jgi:glycine betaine/proline transport system ATP-binding protein
VTGDGPGADPVVEVEGLWKIFGPEPAEALEQARAGADRSELAAGGSLPAVADVSFTVEPGQNFIVMGLSGSGKSTLLRCLARLIEPTAGTVTIDGARVFDLSPDELRDLRRQRLAMVFQHFGLLPHRSVLGNVVYGLEVQGVDRGARTEAGLRALAQVGLDEWADARLDELSGGMQQRVGLARALAVEPEIVFFDEPFSALDPLIRREMQDQLLDLQRRERRTIVFVTHDFDEALRLGDRIAIMRDGAIEQIGTASDLVLSPATDYVAEFTRDVARARVVPVGALVGAAPVDEVGAPGDTLVGAVPVDADTPLDQVIPRLLAGLDPVPVVGPDGTYVGDIDRAAATELLAQDRPTP